MLACIRHEGELRFTSALLWLVHSYLGPQTKEWVWTWVSEAGKKGLEKQGIFEIDWQQKGGLDLIALTLESMEVRVIDAKKIPALRAAKVRH